MQSPFEQADYRYYWRRLADGFGRMTKTQTLRERQGVRRIVYESKKRK
jgi:hypothetical protein